MLTLVSGATRTVADAPVWIGRLFVPRAGNTPDPSRPWAVDNGAFSGFDADRFLRLLDWIYALRVRGCLFVTAPDVVGDATQTRYLYREWAPVIRRYGLPVAYVLQDGQPPRDVPWDCDAVFVGGSTTYKLSSSAASLVGYARARGKWTHMGRVNTGRRWRYARYIGCSSVDGSGFSRWPSEMLRRLTQWEDAWQRQPRLAW